MQCTSKMLAAPIIAEETLILVPAKAFKSRQADALRALVQAFPRNGKKRLSPRTFFAPFRMKHTHMAGLLS